MLWIGKDESVDEYCGVESRRDTVDLVVEVRVVDVGLDVVVVVRTATVHYNNVNILLHY